MNKIKKILKVGQKAHFWAKNHQNLHVFRYIDTTPRSREKVELAGFFLPGRRYFTKIKDFSNFNLLLILYIIYFIMRRLQHTCIYFTRV